MDEQDSIVHMYKTMLKSAQEDLDYEMVAFEQRADDYDLELVVREGNLREELQRLATATRATADLIAKYRTK